jgi:nucleotide-binding universal stress UspA family protein
MTGDGRLPAVSEALSQTLFRRGVLGLNGGPTDRLVVKLGCELARNHGTELVALHVVEVDWRHGLGEEIPGSEDTASAVLDMAEGIAESYHVRLRTELLQARDVGAALVDEAVELEADAVILGLPYRTRFGGDFAIGSTIPYVFQNAPCKVLVVREPIAVTEGRQTQVHGLIHGGSKG